MKKYIKLLRVKHYIKNILVLIPMVFANNLFELFQISQAAIGFVMFSLISSVVYIFNDIQDIEKDRQHPTKRHRPLASGEIKLKNAQIIGIILVVIVLVMDIIVVDYKLLPLSVLILYLIINILYSKYLKNYPIIDVVILAFGYILRIYFGALLVDVEISAWLYLSMMSLSFFLGFGKRRNELLKRGMTYRQVLRYYPKEFLDKVMYMFLGITIVFYSLWCEAAAKIYGNIVLLSVPIVIVTALKYTLIIEQDSDGDPVEVILSDKILLCLGVVYALLMLYVLYGR